MPPENGPFVGKPAASSPLIAVERASKFELVLNLKTAKALGLTILPSVIGSADQVIE